MAAPEAFIKCCPFANPIKGVTQDKPGNLLSFFFTQAINMSIKIHFNQVIKYIR